MTTLEHLRRSHEWTQADLAKRAGVSMRTVHALEHGRACRPPTAKKLLRGLGLAWEERGLVFEQAYPAPRRSGLSGAAWKARRQTGQLREVSAMRSSVARGTTLEVSP